MYYAQKFIQGLPINERPENTEGYQGFFHLHSIEGKVEKTILKYIIRDFDLLRFKARKEMVVSLTNQLNNEFKEVGFTAEIKDQYFNMKEKVTPLMHIIDIAEQI